MKFHAVVLALALGAASASEDPIAKFQPQSNVVPHNKIDLSAYAMAQALAGSTLSGYDTYQEIGASQVSVLKSSFPKYELALKLYNKGGGGSSHYVEYEKKSSASLVLTDSSASVTEISQTGLKCTVPDYDSGATIGKYAGKSAVTASTSKLKMYFDDNSNKGYLGCGRLGVEKDSTDESGIPSNVDVYDGPFEEADCPTLAEANSGGVECVNGNLKVVMGIGDVLAQKLGGRSLKGFSTDGAAKMTAEPEFIAMKKAHGGDTNAQTMFDETVQLAMNALTASTAKFSECEDGNSARVVTGVTESSCGDNTFTQGNCICKKTSNRRAFIPTGSDHAAQVQNCASNGGKVSDFEARDDKFNIDLAKKVAVYGNAWLYTIHEFEDAVADCLGGDIHDNDAGVHAWEEGVAFYTGSRAGQHKDDSATANTGTRNGNMMYELANKRCANFGTCGSSDGLSGNSKVNIKLFPHFTYGQYQCALGDCSGAAATLADHIIPQMTVPLVQGTLRYAYKMDKLNANEKAYGEGYAFMMTVIHRVDACNEADAKIIYNAMDLPPAGGGLAGTATYTTVKEAFERNYACMGIKCSDVGALRVEGQEADIAMGAEGCTDAAASSSSASTTTEEKLPDWALGVIIGAGVLAVLFFGMMCSYKASKDTTVKMYQDLKKEGALGKV